MSFGAGSARRLVRRFSNGATLTVVEPGASVLADDLSVTLTASSFTATCSHPVPYTGGERLGERVLEGFSTVFLERGDPAITFEPQKGQVATCLGEQYRIERVDYGPSWIRIDLRGGAAEGTAGA